MSKISKKQFKQYIESFDFTGLFNQLGWTYLDEQTPVRLKEETYLFHSVAEKGGFRIMVFKPTKQQDLPDYSTRLQLDRKIGKLFREHLIIFCDKNNSIQIWQLFVKQLGKPSRLSETRWHKGQEPELLYQKTSNLFFTLDQEDNITIADVVDVVNENFSKNVEQVTKKFYENFRKEHKKFIEFIKGVSVVTDREWYASLMLNRLMFCYFIQKKGFLDNNLIYLKEKLTYSQQKKGKDKFYVSFYKNFLLALFHQGLGSPDQSEELKKEFGKIPYLNGGLFDVHELERQYENIDISDKAFENVFHFFDQYNWHLDTRITASGKDINPDVIGYIFEKYINDRTQMGAYYTKEDITDYISKNCVVPFLFDETERKYAKAFKPESEIWQMLKDLKDTYIYPAVKHGISVDIRFKQTEPEYFLKEPLVLPDEIEIGLNTMKPNLLERRKAWNKPAPAEYALPTEIWREVFDRRKQYAEIKEKIEKGEITHINDLITYNLNIRQFVQDVIDNHNDPDFIRHFYDTLSSITIIDPTCGSGAFLFAAMNILEPIYESCIQRMVNFVEEAPKGKYAKFEEILKYVKAPEHPNLKYFVFKNIILRNLYGVDIMKEAVEIAKLRLFLKLVATVDADYRKPNLGLEPLPDIDFNIRSGNTLIGYATKKEIDDLQGMFVTPKMKEQILEECDLVSRAFKRFKEIQLKGYENKKEFTQAKNELNKRLNKLGDNLNEILYKQHYESMDYEKWLQTHQPFHWFAEFYEIINDRNGFDVVIGNPPYVEYSKVRDIYRITNYMTEKCGNLYAFVMEQSLKISKLQVKIGMIVPMSITCTERMKSIQNVLKLSKHCYISNFSDSPGLFDGVDRTISIILFDKNGITRNIFSTNFYKWKSIQRKFLVDSIKYFNITNINYYDTIIPKIKHNIEKNILNKLYVKKNRIGAYLVKDSLYKIYYRTTGGRHYKAFTDFQPKFYLDGKRQPSTRETFISLKDKNTMMGILSILNSSLYMWFYYLNSNCRDNNPSDIGRLPFDLNNKFLENLSNLSVRLMNDLKENSTMENSNNGRGKTQTFSYSLSKPIIDEIDTVLAEHFGFTEEELDFIINYDIKYRMGKELENVQEE